MALAMPVVWSDRCRLHEPGGEIWVGVRTPGPRFPRASRRARTLVGTAPASSRPSRTRTRPCCGFTTSVLRRTSPLPGTTGTAADLPEDPGQDRVVPYVFAHRGLRPRRAFRPRPGRAGPLRLRHDDPDRPWHLGGGTGRGRRRADRRRPRAWRASRAAYALLPAARPSRHADRVRRLLLLEQRRRRRRRAAATAAGAASRCSTSTPTTATARRRSSRTRPTCSSAPSTSTRAPAGSRTSSASPTRPAPGRRRRERQPAALARARATSRGWRPSPSSPMGAGSDAGLVVALGVDAAGGDPESPLEVTADGLSRGRRAARRPADCRPCSSRRAATTSSTIGALVRGDAARRRGGQAA